MSSYLDWIRRRQQEDLPEQVNDSEYLEQLRNAEGEEFEEAVQVHTSRLGKYVLYSQDREEHASQRYAGIQMRRKKQREREKKRRAEERRRRAEERGSGHGQ